MRIPEEFRKPGERNRRFRAQLLLRFSLHGNQHWDLHGRGVSLQFIRPGKPVENAFVESFNGKFRDECLNTHWFMTLTDAQRAIEAWRVEYQVDEIARSVGSKRLLELAKQVR